MPRFLNDKSHFTFLFLILWQCDQLILRKYVWFGMYSDIENYIKLNEKFINVKNDLLVQNSEILKDHLDLIGPLKNQQYMYGIMDHLGI